MVIYTPFFTFQKFWLKKVHGITFFPLKKIFLIIRGKYILFLFELREKVLENNKNLRKTQGKVKYKTAVIPECTINILNWMFSSAGAVGNLNLMSLKVGDILCILCWSFATALVDN